ncbi:glutamyl-Q tRNA(Asp) synthetase [Bifidobacterium aerophilum]|uniref:tRNA glutamyl-Q(34) synthetase GluQRS n=1 Tax=Bifidobacterium aerophilum TaxID=1798155 RepID=A0A6N9Z6E7_9BIFI|nr:glutamyl-Q tRNA(Asp) synthetase [Bifidobacterium aerophilum]NEG90202.1 tRNA glutamyl-Q(34) synthetase GluQRS [Bifidobacterium aerophilum]
MSAMSVVGRFAPTPSGRMHLGNIYAMLAAWLSSRSTGGRMVLRIEDIDRPRVLPDADRWIMDDLTWLGLDWDGEPVYQSDRLCRYDEAIRVLCGDGVVDETDCKKSVSAAALRDDRVDVGHRCTGIVSNETGSAESVHVGAVCEEPVYAPDAVYPCFCSRADIRAASAPQEGDGFVVYPGTCRRLLHERPDEVRSRLQAGRQHSLRLFAPDRDIRFIDRVFGSQTFNLAHDLGDTVIKRADGLFAYQLAVTVDDLDMGVTDVVRGRDLLRSTALQLHIRERLLAGGWRSDSSADGRPAAPRSDARHGTGHAGDAGDIDHAGLVFAHLPLIDNAAGKRLAKRQRSLDMGVLRSQGVTARQVIGYCGWLLGLLDEPQPCESGELLDVFDWDKVALRAQDRRVPDNPFAV